MKILLKKKLVKQNLFKTYKNIGKTLWNDETYIKIFYLIKEFMEVKFVEFG